MKELNELKALDMPNGKPPNPHPNGLPNQAPAGSIINTVAAAAEHIANIFLNIPVSYLRYVLIENILFNITCVFSGNISGSERLLLFS